MILIRTLKSFDLTNGFCLTSSNCGSTQYCDRDLPNPIGKCKEGYKEGERCIRDKHCASKRCNFFKCVSREKVKDGLCNKKWKNTDCPENQYCEEIEDEKYKCIDRKCLGLCKRNSQCLSDRCHLFTCVKHETC